MFVIAYEFNPKSRVDPSTELISRVFYSPKVGRQTDKRGGTAIGISEPEFAPIPPTLEAPQERIENGGESA